MIEVLFAAATASLLTAAWLRCRPAPARRRTRLYGFSPTVGMAMLLLTPQPPTAPVDPAAAEALLATKRAAVTSAPHDPQLWDSLGKEALRYGRHGEAQGAYLRLLEIGDATGDPRLQGIAFDRLGVVAASQGDRSGACRLWTRSQRLLDGQDEDARRAKLLAALAAAGCQ